LYNKINCVIEKCTSDIKMTSNNRRIKQWMTAGVSHEKLTFNENEKSIIFINALFIYYKS
jgi:hypothetical protein